MTVVETVFVAQFWLIVLNFLSKWILMWCLILELAVAWYEYLGTGRKLCLGHSKMIR